MQTFSEFSLSLVLLLLLSLFFFFVLLKPKRQTLPLPPGPRHIPLLGNLLWLHHSTSLPSIELLLKNLLPRLGPIVTLRFGPFVSIFIADRSLAHKALVEQGPAFSSRPPPPPSSRLPNSRVQTISSSPYGDRWRLLRRNLTSEILLPAKIRLFAPARRWVLRLLVRDLNAKSEASPQRAVVAMESFQLAMFGLLVLMCFGERLDEKAIREIEVAQRDLLLFSTRKMRVFAFVPRLLSRIMFRGRLRELEKLRQRQRELFLPFIRGRREHRKQGEEEGFVCSYVDSLFNIIVEEEGGSRLADEEMIPLCSEFLVAGTDTTATALQWIMAEIVANSDIQAKLVQEMEGMEGEEIKEEDLQKLPYLKAVVLEGLRRHPPVYFMMPHSVIEDVEFGGYLVPKHASINFMVADRVGREGVGGSNGVQAGAVCGRGRYHGGEGDKDGAFRRREEDLSRRRARLASRRVFCC